MKLNVWWLAALCVVAACDYGASQEADDVTVILKANKKTGEATSPAEPPAVEDSTGACTSNADCAVIEYCAKATGDCDGVGLCATRPQACILIYDPVCGCDEEIYGNACQAAANGQNVSRRGECPKAEEHPPINQDPPIVPACTSNLDCGKTEYCEKAAGDCAGVGACRVRPSACIQIYYPVCGCDEKSYGNDCQAASAGVNVKSKGECPRHYE